MLDKQHQQAGQQTAARPGRLLDLRFLVRHVLAHDGIVLLDFHLFRMETLVLRRRVEMAGAGAGDQLNFVTHGNTPQTALNVLAARTHLGKDVSHAVLFDGTKALGRDAQSDPAALFLNPKALRVQVWEETAATLVVGVRHGVADGRLLSGDLTDSGHGKNPDAT